MVLDIKFQFYQASIYSKKPLGELTLRQLTESIRNPKPVIKEYFNAIRAEKDKKLRDNLKEKLYMFTPSIITDGVNRGYDNIISFNPLMVVEWDNLHPERAAYLKYRIFEDYKSCICAFISPSGSGVKFIFHTEVPKNIEEYKQLWYGLVFHLEDIEPGVDFCNERCTQVLFLSEDSNILVRENPDVWVKKTQKINTFPTKADCALDCDKEPTEESTSKVKFRILRIIENFSGENGHKLITGLSALVGGYISGGEISFEEAEDFIHSEIDKHYYFSKKANTYKKTASRFLITGQNAPLTLED